MTLEQRLTDDMKDAMRAKDELKLSVIRMLRGQILLEKKKGTGVTDVPDDVVVALVRGRVVIAGLVDGDCTGRMRIAPLAARRILSLLGFNRALDRPSGPFLLSAHLRSSP